MVNGCLSQKDAPTVYTFIYIFVSAKHQKLQLQFAPLFCCPTRREVSSAQKLLATTKIVERQTPART